MEGFRTAEEVADYLADSGLEAMDIQPLEDAKHIFTHRSTMTISTSSPPTSRESTHFLM